MCVLTFSYKNHKNYELIVAANRDEFYARPTKPAEFWKDDHHIYGGRDLKEDGTWLSVSTAGKFAAITNYRDLSNINPTAPSRGKLVSDFLANAYTAEEYSQKLLEEGKQYNGFNLVYTDFNKMYYYNNVTNEAKELPSGIYGLSNAFLDTDWPKLTTLKNKFEGALKDDEPDFDKLFSILDERAAYPDELLPDTKIGLELERVLSPIFIVSPQYGTRSSTVLSVSKTRVCRFAEKTFNKGNEPELKDYKIGIEYNLDEFMKNKPSCNWRKMDIDKIINLEDLLACGFVMGQHILENIKNKKVLSVEAYLPDITSEEELYTPEQSIIHEYFYDNRRENIKDFLLTILDDDKTIIVENWMYKEKDLNYRIPEYPYFIYNGIQYYFHNKSVIDADLQGMINNAAWFPTVFALINKRFDFENGEKITDETMYDILAHIGIAYVGAYDEGSYIRVKFQKK